MRTLIEIVQQLEACNFTSQYGDLKNNVAFKELKALAQEQTPAARVEKILTDAGRIIIVHGIIEYGHQFIDSYGAIINVYDTGRISIQGKHSARPALEQLFKKHQIEQA